MADYKELLRRAISALPENNGAARRAVYEKARSALVGQLRAIQPPLPARDITQHRLQLEDCIRQVEQEASEAVISLRRGSVFGRPMAQPVEPPVAAPEPEPEPEPQPEPEPEPEPEPQPRFELRPRFEPAQPNYPAFEPVQPAYPQAQGDSPARSGTSIEDIIADAAEASGAELVREEGPVDVPVAVPNENEAQAVVTPVAESEPESVEKISKPRARWLPSFGRAKGARKAEAETAGASELPSDAPLHAPVQEPQDQPDSFADDKPAAEEGARRGALLNFARRTEPASSMGPSPVEAALSSVREVEVEAAQPDTSEAEGAIERAIETLDREARGESQATPAESTEPVAVGPARPAVPNMFAMPERAELPGGAGEDNSDNFVPVSEPRSGTGLSIFLIVFAVLLVGVGGAGFWAWREGYVDLNQMFGQASTAVAEAPEPEPDLTTPTLDPVPPNGDIAATDQPAVPGNTATQTAAEPTTALEALETEDRLEPTPEPVVPDGTQTSLPELGGGADDKSEERLPGEDPNAAVALNDPAASVDPAVLSGSQSLLLEASQDGRTGAVPFSGTIEWREGVDEIGQPTLIGQANIPARNLGVEMTIRKNSDPSLPASHLMEVDFDVSDTFIGGTIAGLPGVLLKDQELVPGTPLVGASARVVGNSYLFALSAAEQDANTNQDLLRSRKWMDLAVVYGTGRNAIITLEKDEQAQALFDKVFAAWGQGGN
ncbi:hypothetical protein [Devosia sp. 919]|uniref:hypothetical protein n=1 Tax=Devosia sp. 919 TaxID=2726065 RepID=UPI0015537C32|nr:hypothetical protein [Devosia sp. 919]